MAFTPKTAPFSGKINAVTLGTGDKAIVIGGQNVMPFYTFDAPIENAPKIGVEISDLAASWDAPALKEFYAGCTTMADYAKKLDGKFEIKGGFMEGKVVSLETVNALAAIPALPVLQAQVLGTMLAPISALACVLKQIAEKNGAPAEDAAPAEEAPAAE